MTDADDLDKAALHAGAMLAAMGIGGDDKTATRLVRALDELARHRGDDPDRHLRVQFPAPAVPGLVVVSDVPFASLCEHHLLPFDGVATLAYLPRPGQGVVGLSKLARLVQEYAARPQLQERLTHQLCTALGTLDPAGVACSVRGRHTCMALRGATTGPTASMVTTQYHGDLALAPWREAFADCLHTAAWR